MKPALSLLRTAMVVGLAALIAPTARAERDYDFAKALMERDEQSFPTDDLVEHLANQLAQKPETQMDAKLIRATLRVRQAGNASPEKRKALLDQAEALYREILAGPKNYKYYDVAEREAPTINSKRAIVTRKAAEANAKANPELAKKLRKEAVETMAQIAAGHKAEADAAFPKFKEIFEKKYKPWNDKENAGGTGEKQIPKEILEPLAKTFDGWWLAQRKYIATKIEQLECYEDNDPARKSEGEALAKLLKGYIDGGKGYELENEALANFPVIVAWCNYMLGRTYAALQNEGSAAEAWQQALQVEVNDMAPEQKKAIFTIKKSIMHDLVKLKMHNKRYSDVESAIQDARMDPALKSLFDEDAGKELMIDYAKALTLPPDSSSAEYEKAIKTLRELIKKESSGNTATRWANEYARTIAELIEDARQKGKPRPKLSAAEWYDAARGFFLMGQQEYLKYNEIAKDDTKKRKAQFEKAYHEYQSAVDYYHRSIAETRKSRGDLLARIDIEPKAWFEMGLSYLKMEHYYEAIIAYQAMRDGYLPDSRKKWVPDLTKAENRLIAKKVTDTFAELDRTPDGLNAKSGKNIMFALDKNIELHKNPQDYWNPKLKPDLLGTDKDIASGERNITDSDYLAAKADMTMAKGFSDSAKAAREAKQAEEMFTQSEAKYCSAAARFLKVKPGTPAYELALYQSGSAYTMAQAIWATGRLGTRADQAAKCKELSLKAVDAFNKYDALLKSKPSDNEDDTKRRKSLEGTVLLARNALHSGAGEWEQVIKTADDYVAWEGQQENLPRSERDVALLNKFRAQIELASTNVVPNCDPYLDGAEKTMREWRGIKQKENKVYVFMLNALSRRNNMAAFQIADLVKKGNAAFKADMAEKYENKVADLQAERVEMIEGSEDQEPVLEDYSRLVYLFDKTGRDRLCADFAKQLLDKFDPQNKNARIADDEAIWKDKLAKMQAVIRYNDLNKWDRCKKDHAVLIDYMYDTAAGLNAPSPDKRPEGDKFNADMEKARNQIETIRKNYADCQTLYPKFGENGKGLLQIVEDEVDFRRKIMATREVLVNKSLKVATQYDKDGQSDTGKRYKDIALQQLKIISDVKGDPPEVTLLQAELAISLGKLDEAMELTNKVRTTVDSESLPYFTASRKASEIYALKKKWREAAEYPEFVALTIGFDARRVVERWADMKLFLKNCYDNGAPMPQQLKSVFEAGAAPKKADEPKAEPKAEEKKADAAK